LNAGTAPTLRPLLVSTMKNRNERQTRNVSAGIKEKNYEATGTMEISTITPSLPPLEGNTVKYRSFRIYSSDSR